MTAETEHFIEQMDENRTAGAASHMLTEWHAIDWYHAHRNVRRLQARIVKATQEGKWGKVKALQRSTSPLVQRQSAGCETSDRKPRQEHCGGGPHSLEHSPKEDEWGVLPQATRLPSPTSEANLHPQEKWQDAPVKHSLHALQVHAGPLLAGTQSSSGSHRRSKLLWISPRTLHRGRHQTVFHCPGLETIGTMDRGGGHTVVL